MNKRGNGRVYGLVIATLLLALIFTPVIAARGVELRVNAPEEVAEGCTFEVSIALEGIDDLNGAKFDLSFDSSVVDVISVTEGNVDGTAIPAEMFPDDDDDGHITVIAAMSGITGVSGSGDLAKVSFEVVGGKRDRSELEISNVELVDNAAEFIAVGKLRGTEINVVDVVEEEESEEEQLPTITAWVPTEEAINSTEGESITFEISVDQEVDISWQINDTEVQQDEGVTKAEYTKSAVAGTWNVSAIVTNTETDLSGMHIWIWSVAAESAEASEGSQTPTPTLTSGVTQTPTPKATPSSSQTVKSTPTAKPTSTPKSKETAPTPTSKTPGFDAIFAIAAISAIAYALRRRR
ncbi:Cohesin domain-containing protein [Methanophagales archaeon]|nr:Cohesin domain-containing protein [Methanophagales archaeon]